MRGLFSWLTGRPPRFKTGDRVRVVKGAFAAFEGTVQSATHWRIDVVIDKMPGVVELGPDQVQPVSPTG